MTDACYQLTARLVTESPLHVGSGRRTGVIKHTLSYIPGSFLRGAIGISLIRLASEREYAELFGDDTCRASHIYFRYLYSTHLSCKSGGTYLPVPKYMFVCKNPQCQKIYDRLVPPEVCEGTHEGSKSLKPLEGYVCNECGHVTTQPVAISRVVSTAIDRATHSAAQFALQGQSEEQEKAGTLHALDVIEAGAEFAVEIVFDRDVGERLKLIENLLQTSLTDMGIGGGKSRGLGKVRVKEIVEKTITTDLLEQQAKEIDTRDFLVRFVSPMVLKRDEPRSGQFLSPRKLLEACRRAYTWCFHEGKPSLPEVEVVRLGTKRFSFEGFSGWSLKNDKRREVLGAVSAGSVFEFKCDRHDETLALALAALEYQGVGDFKPHGCGQVMIEKPR